MSDPTNGLWMNDYKINAAWIGGAPIGIIIKAHDFLESLPMKTPVSIGYYEPYGWFIFSSTEHSATMLYSEKILKK